MWRRYRWVPVFLALLCLGLACWDATRGQWGWTGIHATFIGVNLANAGFCHWQYRLAWARSS